MFLLAPSSARAPYRTRAKRVGTCGRYFFSSGLMFASSSSNDIAPLSRSPLTKNVGVESTLSDLIGQIAGRRRACRAASDPSRRSRHACSLIPACLPITFRVILGLRHQLLLLLEQGLDGAEKFLGIVIGDAARQHRCRRGLDVEREFPEHETHLAGVDIFRLAASEIRSRRTPRNAGSSSTNIR